MSSHKRFEIVCTGPEDYKGCGAKFLGTGKNTLKLCPQCTADRLRKIKGEKYRAKVAEAKAAPAAQ